MSISANNCQRSVHIFITTKNTALPLPSGKSPSREKLVCIFLCTAQLGPVNFPDQLKKHGGLLFAVYQNKLSWRPEVGPGLRGSILTREYLSGCKMSTISFPLDAELRPRPRLPSPHAPPSQFPTFPSHSPLTFNTKRPDFFETRRY